MKRMSSKLYCLLAVVAAAFAAMGAAPSVGMAAGPRLKLNMHMPMYLSTTGTMFVHIMVQNVGDQPTNGPIEVADTMSPGLSALQYSNSHVSGGESQSAACEDVGQTMKCAYPGVLQPGVQLMIEAIMQIPKEASGTVTNSVFVSGGGASGTVSEVQHMTVGPPGPFEFTSAAAQLLGQDGSSDVQAGSDPAEFTTSMTWSSFAADFFKFIVEDVPVERFKDVITHLPAGLIGNPSSTPALCTADQLAQIAPELHFIPACPPDSQIGIAHVYLTDSVGIDSEYTPLYNMVAPYGVATELGFAYFQTVILLQAYVRPGDHGIDIVSRDTTTSVPVSHVDVTVWGDPADHSHDRYRGACLESDLLADLAPTGKACTTKEPHTAFLRLPTSCSGSPLPFGLESSSYEHPEKYISASFTTPKLTGCDLVPFSPSIKVDPTGTVAGSPTGVAVKVSLPQDNGPQGLSEADLKKAVVTLPEGMALNPSSADGLEACDDAHLRLDSNVPADCPDGSKVGTVLLHTQLLSNPIEGTIYVRPQNSNDPTSGEMFRIAFELRDDSHGIDFKIPGHISANPVTGRLTTTFDNDPQLPFEDISLRFKSGARAPLTTPQSCLEQTTEADLYSWAQPDVPVHRSNSFALTSGPAGTACPPPVPFHPGFNAGTGNVEAGNYTPFLATFTRSDADQSMQRVSVKMPKGLLGSLAGLPLCGEAQANAGTCSSDSQIGTMTAGAGSGPTPFYVTGGHVYMTGPYEGAPFGLSIVVPAKAGPFDLGTVVVRAKVQVDPQTAQLTVTTDPLPQVVGGVPVNLRLVNVTINRPDFVFNPTDCDHTEVTGSMTGGQGATASLANGFQVTNCAALGFTPKFSVTTNGKTSRVNGVSLDARLSYPKSAPFGSQVNISKVKVSLPKQLPSRLKTLQKACPADTFNQNPAACPTASRIGTATANTPVLPVPLTGPVYFVSHGGQAFPDLIVVLQGYGVTVDLIGNTFISKGITSTTFNTVPDVPIGTFELKLPQGPNSALAANGNLCTTTSLKMPTVFTAQDGQVIHTNTPINPTGCAKHRKHSHNHKHKKHKKK